VTRCADRHRIFPPIRPAARKPQDRAR
jgi:hypothetical protein